MPHTEDCILRLDQAECRHCKTRASLPLGAIRRPRETPIWKQLDHAQTTATHRCADDQADRHARDHAWRTGAAFLDTAGWLWHPGTKRSYPAPLPMFIFQHLCYPAVTGTGDHALGLVHPRVGVPKNSSSQAILPQISLNHRCDCAAAFRVYGASRGTVVR
jgi:hypothetical protein